MEFDATSADPFPFVTHEVPPVPGRIRATIDDFRVDELPLYDPSGEGDHLYIRFEKTDLTTPEAVKRLARAVGTEPRDAGYAGLKDRRAVTTQWASFLFGDAERARSTDIAGIRILEIARHRNKLRTGHLRANRFEIHVRGVPPERLDDVRRALEVLERRGVPSYYGEQRFGAGGGNLERANEWLLRGGRAPRDRFERKLLVSTLQSHLFNVYLAERIAEGLFDRTIRGDVVRREDSGGLFVAEDVAETDARMARWEVSPTGPMFGARMRWPEHDARAREEALLARAGVTAEHLERFARSGEGTRRPIRARVTGIAVSATPEGVLLSFELPAGAYATTLIREVLKEDAAVSEAR